MGARYSSHAAKEENQESGDAGDDEAVENIAQQFRGFGDDPDVVLQRGRIG